MATALQKDLLMVWFLVCTSIVVILFVFEIFFVDFGPMIWKGWGIMIIPYVWTLIMFDCDEKQAVVSGTVLMVPCGLVGLSLMLFG